MYPQGVNPGSASTDNQADGWGGLFCGGLATLVGLFMIVYATRKLAHSSSAEEE